MNHECKLVQRQQSHDTHLEPLRLVVLDGGFALTHDLIENTVLHSAFLVQKLFLAVDAANDVDVPAVLETLRTQALQVTQLKQRLVVRGCARIRPLQMKRLLLPIL